MVRRDAMTDSADNPGKLPDGAAGSSPAARGGGGWTVGETCPVHSDGATLRPDTLDHACALPREIVTPVLHLATSIRSFRAERLSDFVGHVIAGGAQATQNVRGLLTAYPLYITRDLASARSWLGSRVRGTERAGLLASSNAARLKPHGVFVKAKIEPAKWFLARSQDVRSSDALEDAGTEFDVQGLELDWTGVCWDANYRRTDGG